ncbi:ribosomal protection-like ABC-F family protein [Clostridium ihumii]|uniref:ribosomal protection-like ABC-F family protein n=1 Tax=Clostridium ihumii TaxID=1470356 RepID=UPI000551797D|nr:ABC-F family ATP-binding cassette domain-containing protein [Clostridium ihumii]
MSVILECRNIKKNFGEFDILKNINLDIFTGDRIGIVGDNGVGKTTLVKIIKGIYPLDGGNLNWHMKNMNIGYLNQSSYDEELFNKSVVIKKEFLKICSELGISNAENLLNEDRIRSLSGGEKTKLSLAYLFSKNYDMLILDEPTNNLDYDGIEYLIKRISYYKNTILIISHDRYFLDKTTNKTIEIEDGICKEYKGNYSFYRDEKKRIYINTLHRYREQEKYKKNIENQIETLKSWSEKAHRDSTKKASTIGGKKGVKEYFRVKAKKKDIQVKSRIKKLEKIEVEGVKKPKKEKSINFNVNNGENKGTLILKAKNISKSFNGKVLFKNSSFYIKRGEKIALIGKNGCGKTTLIKAILREIQVDGEINLNPNAKIGYMSQEIPELKEAKKIIELFSYKSREEEGILRRELFQMGFTTDDLSKNLSSLSHGERMKIKLLLMIKNNCEVLILDEPTNHIDLHVREELEDALDKYSGTIILVTHDRYMLTKISSKLLVFENNTINRYEYTFDEYINKKNQDKSKENEMILKNRLSYVLGKLCNVQKESEEYMTLDEEYKNILWELKKI